MSFSRHATLLALLAPLALSAAAAPACKSHDSGAPAPAPKGPVGNALASATGAQRLTRAEYAASIHDVFGPEVVVPSAIEPDVAIDGFESIGATSSTVSARGVEQYETAGLAIGNQIVNDEKLKGRVLPCKPAAVDDAACARQFVSSVGPKVFRRPLTDPETGSITAIVTDTGRTLASFEKGLAYGISRMLQSPAFLYRPSVGEPDPDHPGQRRYTAYEFATRLSYFLWDSTPDDALYDAAKTGKLDGFDGLSAQVARMLASPKAHDGLRSFVRQWLRLGDLDLLQKDSKLFTTFTADLGPMAREETLKVFEDLVFEQDADVRDVLVTRRTFVTAKLASMYEVLAPSATGFAPIELPEDGRRRGLLGHASILALYAHPTSSSATLRGKFVREKLLCMTIPPPPVNLNTALPEATDTAKTLRDRVKTHFTNPGCAGCHSMTDPIGLGLEQFDGIGRDRTKESGVVIDPTGKLDGVDFDGPVTLAKAIHDHPRLAPCIARKLYQYATGTTPEALEDATLTALAERFAQNGYRTKALIAAIATSPAFRTLGNPH